MISSLFVGEARYAGSQLAPAGARSSFLTTNAEDPRRGGWDLGQLLGCRAAVVVDKASPAPTHHALPRSVQPYSTHLPGFASIGRYDIRHLSEGRFTEDTIAQMHKGVIQAKTDARWRGMMEEIRQSGRRQGAIGWKDYPGEVRWLDHWYRRQHPIDYVRDPAQVELVNAPAITYMKGLGDCDDSSVLWAASMGVIGAPHRFRTYRADPRRPDEWSHVVAQVHVPNVGWVNNDLTIRGAPPGFEPSGFQHKDWPEPRW